MSRPLRVLEVAPRYFPDLGGTETHVHEVSRRLAQRADLEITVFASDRSGRLPRAERGEGFDIVRRRAWPREGDYYLAPGLVPVIRGGDWDIVHFQGIHTFIPIVGMLAARSAGVPYVVTFHTGGHSSGARSALRDRQWRALAPLLRGASALVGVSRFERRLFERATGIDPERFRVIRNGGGLPEVPAGVHPIPGRIVSSGRLERYKGHHRVIEALPLVRAQIPAAHVVVLGAGELREELLDLARRLGVADAVTVRHVPPGDRAAMAVELASAAALAAFSDYEAHPVGVMEALTLGVPVVGYDVAGIADLVEDGTVLGLPLGAPTEAAAAALVDLLGTERKPGAGVPVDLPTWEDSADRLAEIYLAIGARRPAHRSLAAADRLRVLHVTSTMTTGGAEQQVEHLLRGAVDETGVVCLYERGAIGTALAEGGADVTVLGMRGWTKATAALRLARLLRRRRPDVVHVHMLSAQLWGIPAARLARVPVIVSTEHSIMETSIEGRPKSPGLRLLYLRLAALASRTVAVSGTTARRLQEWGLDPARITVIDNGVDLAALRFTPAARAEVRAELGIDEGTTVIGTVGRLAPEKRLDVAVAALAPRLRAGGALLLVVGDGAGRSALLEQASTLGVAGSVRLLGARRDVPRLLMAMDVLVSPSRDETFGLAVVEGLAAGLPVVYAQAPAVEELRPAPEGAVLLPRPPAGRPDRAADVRALAAALDGLLADGAPPRHGVPAAVADRYSLDRLAGRTAALYRELLRPPAPGRHRTARRTSTPRPTA